MTIKIKPITVDNITSKLGNICLYAFLFLTSFIFLFRYDHTMFILRYVFLIGGALIGYGRCFVGKYRFRYSFLFLITITFLWLLATLGQNGYQNYEVSDYLYTICYIGLAVLVLENKYNHIVALGLYGFTAASIMLRVLQGINKNLILLANSRNFISVLLLSTMLLYYISCMDKKRPILVTPILLYFYINIYATGRSGIIVSGFFTVGLLLYKFYSIENKRLKMVIGFFIAIVIITVLIYISNLDDTIMSDFINKNFSAFLQRGNDSNGRYEIWGKFISNNIKAIGSFLFGSDASLAMADCNLHNSFLQSYASFGVAGFGLIIVLVVRSLIVGFKKKNFLFLILFGGLLLRALTDRVFFQGYCELYLYYFIFYFTYHSHDDEELEGAGDAYAR